MWQVVVVRPLVLALDRYPVVPVFADVTLSLGHVLEKAPHYDAGEGYTAVPPML